MIGLPVVEVHGWCMRVFRMHDRGDASSEERHTTGELLALECVVLADCSPARVAVDDFQDQPAG